MSLQGYSSLSLSFAFADFCCLLLVYEVLNDAVQICIPPGQEENIISSDRSPACMAAEALQIYGDIFCSKSQIS